MDAKATVSRPQFSLRFLLLFTAGVSVALALGVAFGWNTLPLSLGLVWVTTNASGGLRFTQQTPRKRAGWIWLGWLLFLISLGLPVAKGCSNEAIRGWEIATGALGSEGEGIYKLATGDEELYRSEEWREKGKLGYFLTLINLCNLALFLSPLALILARYERGHWLTNWVAVTAVHPWSLSYGSNSAPMSGYVVWALSIAAVVSAYPLTWRVWWLMIAHLGILALLGWE